MTDTDIPPNLRAAVDIMADAVQGMYVFTDNRECIEAECAAALRALLAVGFSVQRWEPIETAPKDGTSVDLWAQGQRWANKRWGRHDPFSDAPFGPEHWIAVTAPRGEPIGFRYIEPTHWMPLPSPPVGAADER